MLKLIQQKIILTAFIMLFPFFLNGQNNSNYDQHEVFSPDLLNHPESPYRSNNGAPGYNYWQNKANYQIKASLDTIKQFITAEVTLTYINNSPDSLDYIWLELGQNLFKEKSIGYYSQNAPGEAGGFSFDKVSFQTKGKWQDADYIISDTRMQIRLPQSIAPKGGKTNFLFKYSFHLSKKQFRMGLVNTKNGSIFEAAQWYPRMCVYDDIRGWNTLPYQGAGEFYCEYGDFDYEVTVPWNMIVAGSGDLINKSEVMTQEQIKRLKQASQSDNTKYIISPEEIGTSSSRPTNKGTLTWHFKMKNSRDVAWSASAAYIWDAAKVNMPNNKNVVAMSVYPVESSGKNAWDRSTESLKHSIEYFSANYYPYPYPVAYNIAGPAGGMEYPGLCFCHWKIDKANVLYFVTAHEIGHNWFPMIVGSDERRYAFMDEGFNTFIDIYAQANFNNEEFGPKRDGEYDPVAKNPSRDLVAYLTRPDAEAIINLHDVMQGKYGHALNYYKGSHGLVLAREYILGHEKFDYAFKQYIKKWAFKHPCPNDFFRMMNNATGEDLNWFWNGWYYQTWTLDQSIEGVDSKENESIITLKNNGKMVMPVTLKIETESGNSEIVRLPVEIWQKGDTYTFHYKSSEPLKAVTIDPDEQLPDTVESNNYWNK